jgi:hypothetical protein
MRYKIPLLFWFLLSLSIYGKEVPVDEAKKAAANFLITQTDFHFKGTNSLSLSPVLFSPATSFKSASTKSATRDDLLYIFDINQDEGFIIVAGDDHAAPILGYSFEHSFNATNIPDNVRKWMEGYKNQVRYVRSNPEAASPQALEEWELLRSGKSLNATKSASAVEPLITTKWNQNPYFNALCPYDSEYGDYAVTGCAATAMAQIMKYWNYPESGSGYYSYSHDTYGVLSANFGATRYDWNAMPDMVNEVNLAVATLMYHCGVSIEMDYGVAANGGSGAYVISSHSPTENCVEYALKTYFDYDPSLKGLERSNYSTPEWIGLLKKELDEGRPVEYCGFGSGGHAFVCDGYDSNDYFHFNWGWGGYNDGYYLVDALNPPGVGTGGGAGNYNYNQQALTGIRPPDSNIEYDLALYDDVSISEDPLFFYDPFTIHSDIGNYGTTTFSGDFCSAIFDADYNFIDYAEILVGYTLEGGMHYTNGLDFDNPGSVGMLPGDYYAAVFYRSGDGNWKVVADGSYTNLLEFSVYYSSDIELYKDFSVSTGTTITQNEAFTITTDILNDAASTFTGDFSVELYDMEGAYAATVETLTGANLEAGYFYSDVVFSSTGVSIDPGTYLLALLHKPDGGQWTLSGSSYYSNPTKVIVKQAPLNPDIYEENDTEETPYLLAVNFTDNAARITTDGSNSHIGTDVDFYRIVLEEGFNYSVSARAHDSYNSGNQEVYSNDVLWAFRYREAWSEFYDDVRPDPINVYNGGEILFGVAPYFEGETGTYLLDISINRMDNLSVETKKRNEIDIYPNPAGKFVVIETSGIMDRIEIYDMKGRLLQTLPVHSTDKTVDMSQFSAGLYNFCIIQEGTASVHKIVKQ